MVLLDWLRRVVLRRRPHKVDKLDRILQELQAMSDAFDDILSKFDALATTLAVDLGAIKADVSTLATELANAAASGHAPSEAQVATANRILASLGASEQGLRDLHASVPNATPPAPVVTPEPAPATPVTPDQTTPTV